MTFNGRKHPRRLTTSSDRFRCILQVYDFTDRDHRFEQLSADQ